MENKFYNNIKDGFKTVINTVKSKPLEILLMTGISGGIVGCGGEKVEPVKAKYMVTGYVTTTDGREMLMDSNLDGQVEEIKDRSNVSGNYQTAYIDTNFFFGDKRELGKPMSPELIRAATGFMNASNEYEYALAKFKYDYDAKQDSIRDAKRAKIIKRKYSMGLEEKTEKGDKH